MYFTKEFISSLKQSIPLEKLIGHYVELKKHGDYHIGRCPFHDEQNPSFTVFPKTQSFYCFGCHAGSKQVTSSSDHIAFLMSHKRLSFPKAVELLAEITHTPLPTNQKEQYPVNETSKHKTTQTHSKPPAEKLSSEISPSTITNVINDPVSQQIFNLAAEFYHQQLFVPENKFALEYLTKQRLRDLQTIKQFNIGFAKGGRQLYQFLKSNNFSDVQLIQSGLIAKRGNRTLDYFFGNILIFPHRKNGNVIGFTIKDLGQYKSEIKLRLFSRNYFYNHDAIHQHNEIILLEGESDLHSISQFTNQSNIVALCGNQLTQPQLSKLQSAKITKVYLCLDHDAAGHKATQNITEKLIAAGIAVHPLPFTCHKDIDLWLKYMPPNQRQASFQRLLDKADANNTSSSNKNKNSPNTKDSHKQDNVKKLQGDDLSNFQLIKELMKTVAILLTTIVILLKNSKTYIKHRKNPQSTKNNYHRRPNFTIDKLPVYEQRENVPHYSVLLEHYEKDNNKSLKPVKRRAGKHKPPKGAVCQFCEAPEQYLSLNNGKKQVYCKVCKHLSNPDKQIKDVTIRCPHCNKTLQKMKKDTEKNGYSYYKCRNKKCSYFIKNQKRLQHLKKKDKKKLIKKLHYIYRKPIIDFTALHPTSPDKPRVDLANVRSSAYVIGLVLTYRAGGQSTRAIANYLNEIHEVSLSHQTIKNYLDAAAYRLAPVVFNYPYDLSGIITSDETYIRAMATWNYLTWSLDPKKQIIAALNVSEKRNLVELAKVINHAVCKFPADMLASHADFNPLFVTDGNPVYQLITQFLRQANIHINHKVVIGLENNDDQSTDFRNLKQIIERLNKNFKKYINDSEHFGATNGTLSAAVIFTAHFNFIRKNSILEGKIPVPIQQVKLNMNQPCRWMQLLKYAQTFDQQLE